MNAYRLIHSITFAFAVSVPLLSIARQDDKIIQANKERAIMIAREGGYQKLITQRAPNGKAPDPKLFTQWILDEINNDSVMRDQIGDELADIENNGHNSNWLTQYYTRDKQYLSHLYFKKADLTVTNIGDGQDSIYDYQFVLRARDAFKRGVTTKSFRFSFKVKTEYFKFTNAYMINIIGYPIFIGKDETEEQW